MTETSLDPIGKDFKAVGDFNRRAILDVAGNVGTKELVEELKPLIANTEDEILPITAFRFLLDRFPDAAELILSRTEEIQKLKHEQDWFRIKTWRKPKPSESVWDQYPQNPPGFLSRILRRTI